MKRLQGLFIAIVFALAAIHSVGALSLATHSWQFEEGSGPTAADSGTPGGATGTLGSSASWTSPGLVGNGAVVLPGPRFNPNSHVDFGTTAAAVGVADFTMMFRVKTTFNTGTYGLAGHGELFGTRDDDSGGNFISVRLNTSGNVSLEILDTVNGVGLSAGSSINDNQSHHVAFSRAGTDVKLYIDGVLRAAGSSPILNVTNDDGSNGGGPRPLRLGRSMLHDCCFNFVTVPFTGDDVRIYGSALSDADIDIIANDPADEDGVLDADDNCPAVANPDQADNDNDGLGDACDADDDGDGVDDGDDNCPLTANPDQADTDGDGSGDVCDADDDGDGVADGVDACLATPAGELVNSTGCSIAQLCPATVTWKNHGAYVSCVAHTATAFQNAGLITAEQHGLIVSTAAKK